MNVSVYILHSTSLDQFYTGISKHAAKRGNEHRKPGKKWTDRADDWREVYRQECETYTQARCLEKSIKKRGAARFLSDALRHNKTLPRAFLRSHHLRGCCAIIMLPKGFEDFLLFGVDELSEVVWIQVYTHFKKVRFLELVEMA